jgi:type II secretory pathway pseudopilin PulG
MGAGYQRMKIRGNGSGFTLVELVVVMGIFIGILLISATAFDNILKGARRETKQAESQVADIVGLELLRIDLEQAGYGLPTSYQQSITYSEAVSASGVPITGKNPADLNVPSSSTLPPRPLAGGTDNTYLNDSDYLVVRSTVAARNPAAQKWTYVITGSNPVASDVSSENFTSGESRIVLRPVFKPTYGNELVMQSATAFYGYSTSSAVANHIRNFYPVEPTEKRIIYGLTDAGVTPRMPFNRADYYIRTPSVAGQLPQRCAPHTGILYKGIVSNTTASGGGEITEIPLMDCVADFQVVFGMDNSGDDGVVDNYVDVDDLQALTVSEMRQRVKEVWAFVLTHEGGGDKNYSYPNSTILVGETIWGTARGHDFDLQNVIQGNWRNYRWRVHKIMVRPKNLF